MVDHGTYLKAVNHPVRKAILQIINDSLQILEGSGQFTNTSIYTMLPFDNNQILIGTNSKGLFVYNPQSQKSESFTKPEKFKEIDIFLSENPQIAYNLRDVGLCIKDQSRPS